MLFDHIPETPIREDWEWETDVIISDNGTEQRISLRASPRRSYSQSFIFDDLNALNRHMRAMFMFGQSFQAPLFCYMTRLTVAALASTSTIECNTRKTELRAGMSALIFDSAGTQLVTVDSVAPDVVTIEEELARDYNLGALICPVSTVVTGNSASVNRNNPDNIAQANLQFTETDYINPFLNAENDTVLPLLNGIPVLLKNAMGKEFEEAYDSGNEQIDYGGIIEIRNPWKHSQIVYPRTYLCNRVTNYLDWDFWRKFADYCKGSQKPFYLPTYREDFETVTPAAPSGTQITVTGHDYLNTYWEHEAFKQIAIYSDAGLHVARITAVADVSGNDRLTFTPALPAGAAWGINQRAGLVVRARIADDRISCEHHGLHTVLNIAIRTTDE